MKNFIIQINKFKDSDTKPDYRIVAKEGEEFLEIGAGWKKQDSSGKAYISCSLSKPYNDKKGYEIVQEGAPESKTDVLSNVNEEVVNTDDNDEIDF